MSASGVSNSLASASIVNAKQACKISVDSIELEAQASIHAEIAKTESLLPEIIKGGIAQVECPDTDVSHSDAESESKNSAIGKLIKKCGSLSSIVRVAGVAAVVLSMCLFLLDGMGVVNDTQRFFTMLMLTSVLSAGGFTLAFLLKEQRGARSFFGLALLSVPVSFTVLGALFYSVFQFDSVTTDYPTVAHWKITELASLGSTILVAVVALVPVTIIGISVIGREGRAWLSGTLLLCSAVLLLPIRDTAIIAPIAAILVITLIGLIKNRGRGIISLKTPAGTFLQSLLFLPPVIMLFRSFWLYDVSSLSAMVIALTVFVVIRYASQSIKPEGFIANLLHVVCVIVAWVAAVLAIDAVPVSLGGHYGALVFCIVFGGLMFDIDCRVQNIRMARLLSIGTSVSLATVILVYHQLYDGVIVFIGGILLSLALVGLGLAQKQRDKMLIGGLTLISVLLLNAGGMIDFFMQTGWLGFASLGAIAILLASLLDRFGAIFSVYVRRWRMQRCVEDKL